MRILSIYYLEVEEGHLEAEQLNEIKEQLDVDYVIEWSYSNEREGVQYPYMEIKEF